MFKKLPISHTRLSSRIITAAVIVSASAVPTLSAQAYERIVALSPDVADVVIALGATNKLVGKDATNTNPA